MTDFATPIFTYVSSPTGVERLRIRDKSQLVKRGPYRSISQAIAIRARQSPTPTPL